MKFLQLAADGAERAGPGGVGTMESKEGLVDLSDEDAFFSYNKKISIWYFIIV